MKKNLNGRIEKIEKRLNQGKKKIGFPCDLSPAEVEELFEKVKNGKEIDWDKYDFAKCGELTEKEINESYEKTKGH